MTTEELKELKGKILEGPWTARTNKGVVYVGKGEISFEPKDGLVEEHIQPHVVRIFTDEDNRRHTQFIAQCCGVGLPNSANAELIALAPSLLDECLEMRQKYDDLVHQRYADIPNCQFEGKTFAEIRTILFTHAALQAERDRLRAALISAVSTLKYTRQRLQRHQISDCEVGVQIASCEASLSESGSQE